MKKIRHSLIIFIFTCIFFQLCPSNVSKSLSGELKTALSIKDVKFDVRFLPVQLRARVIPWTGFSPHNPHSKSPAPEHLLFASQDGNIKMRIYPVDAYMKMWMDEDDFSINIAITRLKRYLAQDDIADLSAPMDILPPRPGLNDIAIFIEKIPFKNGAGIGFVGRITKDIKCVSKDDFSYFFMGLTKDERFLISFEAKLSTKPSIDAGLWHCQKGVLGLQEQIGLLNKKLPMLNVRERLFEPSLSNIKSFIGSIEIQPRSTIR